MAHDITILGETLTLLPQRALLWRKTHTLFVADLHLGKPDAFVQAGIPVPTRVTQRDLERLCAVIEATGAQNLVILGDFLHARASHSPGVMDALEAWRSRCADLRVLLVNGNHDLHAGPPPAALDMEICDEAMVGPFHCVHFPLEGEALATDGFTLCGHLHPYGVVTGRTRESLRLPCFHVSARQLVLPAFGHFTGGHTVYARGGERIFVIAGETVLEARPKQKSAV